MKGSLHTIQYRAVLDLPDATLKSTLLHATLEPTLLHAMLKTALCQTTGSTLSTAKLLAQVRTSGTDSTAPTTDVTMGNRVFSMLTHKETGSATTTAGLRHKITGSSTSGAACLSASLTVPSCHTVREELIAGTLVARGKATSGCKNRKATMQTWPSTLSQSQWLHWHLTARPHQLEGPALRNHSTVTLTAAEALLGRPALHTDHDHATALTAGARASLPCALVKWTWCRTQTQHAIKRLTRETSSWNRR